MEYATICQKLKEIIEFRNQIKSFQQKINQAKQPLMNYEVVTWEEAIAYAQEKVNYEKDVKEWSTAIENRKQLLEDKEEEIVDLLPIQNLFIIFNIEEGDIEKSYKVGYFHHSELIIEELKD